MKRKQFSLIKIFGSVPVDPNKFKDLDKKLKWLGGCEEGNFCVGCGTLTPFIPKSHHANCYSYKDSDEYAEYVNELGRCPECDSPDGLSMDSSMELKLSQISCTDCQFVLQGALCEENLIIAFNKKYQRASQ
ncbi:hypothetical protein MNY66_06010 [Moellerella wisconsensis]|uniref:hypothetical protein n=1 Tax=Moellerella wisconsensis TaxID=158849 RepID=UPI001F4E29B2|nr:hypothetical protein [Moellerella wisconsensis]UNH43526.1 hypothetical protein MNY66_06010 [Moellerella wisconsensis]